MGSGILRAVGDSRRPFYFLLVCAVLNTVLDLYFVLALHMGVEGVALATIIAQFISAILVVIILMRSNSCVRLYPRKLKLHVEMLRKIILVGLPAGLQMAITSFSNVFVQSYINFFGTSCMSGWTVFTKVEQLRILPIQSLSIACTTFVAQNLGARQTERANKGVRIAVGMAVVCISAITTLAAIFAPGIAAFFNSDPDVVYYGSLLLRCITPFGLLSCVNQIFSGALRGAGNSRASMIVMLSSFVVFRQIYLFIMSRVCNQFIPIALGYPAGWAMCCLLMLLYYKHVGLSRNTLAVN
jgi:putative MATE family efflux protein